ncbi:DUF481 domain-containing protein [Mongoliibacter ruber]|uniref:Uncharacterized protein DUF481 n=1 Tax=Mongoliibacter ruber TaxID=1750599 RepID=A0A2T0WFH7_9BACT|nr:DUF481 domain-containing protein [Mongoliibacter ruber]PRY85426.1 uncharacterized protein DUF481 [Mongoliibacter ruber]
MYKYLTPIIFLLVFLSSTTTNAQKDSLIVKNNHYLLGEVKSMEKGVLTFKTPYSKSDFKVKWNEVQSLFSESLFITSTKSARRVYGKISSPETGVIKVTTQDGEEYTFPLEEVLYIKSLERGFLDRISAGIDLGFTLTRARNQRQFTTRSRFSYVSREWSLDASFNKLVTAQEEIENIRRGDGNLTAVYFTRKDWFLLGRMEYLYNTEQFLDLRLNTLVGAGNDLIKSNSLYWRVFGGFAFNNENFVGESMDRQSAEAWIATELNIFDKGDLSLLTNIFVYPSITERNRIRADYRLDLMYKLPLDFYIKTGLTVNYDNQPFQLSRTTDYILQTTFGWSW